MKNLFVYWLLIILPLLIACVIYFQYKGSSWLYVILIYVFLYRPIIDGWRLYNLDLIQQRDFWKLLLPFYRLKFFSRLYLGR